MIITNKNTDARYADCGLQALKVGDVIWEKSPPSMPYRGRETPGPLRHERREYLWISHPPRRPR